jgi:ADP-ribose diphosphatase
MAREIPDILKKEVIAKTRLFNVEAVHLRFSNGEERIFERIRSGDQGAVLVIPRYDEETFLLIREYAVGVEGYQLGFPKGVIDADEELLVAANRELQEEIGYGAKDLQFIQSVKTSPGHLTSTMHIVYASDLYESRLEGDEPEPLEVVPWKITDIAQLINHPEFLDARSLVALLLLHGGFIK